VTIEGRCTNFGNCTVADTKTPQPMTSGADAFCPECGAQLHAVRPPAPAWRRPVIAAIAVAAVVLIAAIALWRSHQPENVAVVVSPSPSASSAAAAVTLRLCGSRLMAERLATLLSEGFALHRSPGAASDGGVRTTTAAGGTSTAFDLLGANGCDVGMASRQITPAERARLRALGDMTSRAAEHVIGLDGITILVNRANRVSALSVGDVRRVFSGSAKDWSAFHGAPGAIRLYAPAGNTGTLDAFKLLVMGGSPFSPALHKVSASGDVAAAVARDPQAVGFVALPYANRAKALKIASGPVALAPTVLTVGRETYPLSRRLYLYTAPRKASAAANAFVAFAQSDEGQLLVDRAGFVGTTSTAIPRSPVVVPPNAPPAYARLAQTTRQSEFVFYFNVGSDALDNKALVDIGRLVAAMSTPANRDQQIVLAGFADSTGDHERNIALSLARARSVQRELTSQGVRVKEALGFGDAMPIRDNATPEGREKNRRVEIFVTFRPSP
jgi:phosphate transport system substrate-binding protein